MNDIYLSALLIYRSLSILGRPLIRWTDTTHNRKKNLKSIIYMLQAREGVLWYTEFSNLNKK